MTLVAVSFSQDNPSNYTSLAPTFITFMNMLDGTTITPPGITQLAFTGIYMFAHQTSTPFYFKLDAITVSTSTDRYVYGVLGPIQQVDIQLSQLSSTLAAYNSTIGANFSTLTAYSSSLTALGVTANAFGATNIALNTSQIAQGNTLTAYGTSNYALNNTILANLGSGASLSTDILARIGSTASSFGTTSVDPVDLFGFSKRNQEVLEGDQTFNKVSGAWDISTRGGTLLIEKTLSQTATQVSKS